MPCLHPPPPPRPIEVREAEWAVEASRLLAVRHTVFVGEQNVPVHLENDGLDPGHWHVVAEDRDIPVGTARLAPDGKIGRVAVLPDFRRRGLGRRLMHTLLSIARREGISEIHLHAQLGSTTFYRELGFVETGEPFDEAGIPHIAMCLSTESPRA